MDMVLGLGRLEEPLVPTRPIQVPGRYAAAALRRACEAVAGAAPGTRNSTLNTEAFGMGQLVAAGLLSEEDAVMHLAEAAFMCGLGSDEVTTTIASGLRAGLRSPRDMEETEDAD